jgi:hypothetical protein
VVVVDPDRVAGLASGWARRCELEAFGPYETVVDAQAALERLLEDFAEWPQLRLFLVPIYEGS